MKRSIAWLDKKRQVAYIRQFPLYMDYSARRLHDEIMRAKHILLEPHQHPDGDALGSVGAFMQWLRELQKPHMAFCPTPISERLRYLPHADYMVTDPAIWHEEKFDLIIVFDSGDLTYAGIQTHIDALPYKPLVANIDHHISNTFFGDINLVYPKASSTSEVLYTFLRENNVVIRRDIATCLLTGLMYDTNNFTNAGTTDRSLVIAGELIHAGGDIHMVRKALFQDKTMHALKLWGTVLGRLDKHDELNLVHTFITLDDLAAHGATDKDTEGIANLLNVLGDGKASLVLRELEGGKVKASFRTTHDDVDVSLWAGLFGGGGHKKAAGFVTEGTIESVREKIMAGIRGNGAVVAEFANQ